MPVRPARTVALVVVGTPVVAASLAAGAGVPVLDAFLLAGFLLLLPGLAVAQLPLAAEAPLPPKGSIYVASSVTALVVGGVALAAGSRSGTGPILSLEAVPPGELVAWVVGLAAAGLAVTFAVRAAAIRLGIADTPLLEVVLPRTPGERLAFVGVSAAAGIGEELAYRGYVLGVLAGVTGSPWLAAAAAAAAFGMVHAYQGLLGVVRTGIVGFLLAAPVILAGSIWPAILAHALFDVLAGSVLGERLLSRPKSEG